MLCYALPWHRHKDLLAIHTRIQLHRRVPYGLFDQRQSLRR